MSEDFEKFAEATKKFKKVFLEEILKDIHKIKKTIKNWRCWYDNRRK